jgi:acyl-CoA synthetase (AMP-forming)/AMP-acid ligase II
MNLMSLLASAAGAFGQRTAFCNGQDSITYTELLQAAGTAAAQLQKSDSAHLAMLDVSSFALPIGLFASAWAGRPFVPINYRLSDGEINALLERIAPARLITDNEWARQLATHPAVECINRDSFIAQARAQSHAHEADWDMDPEATAVLLFTSGTTGAPKAAVLRQRHLVSYMHSAVEFGSAAEEEVLLVAVPPYHIAGIVSVISAVYAGRKVVQLPNFNARRWIELAQQERVTTAFLVPTMLRAIVAELELLGRPELPHLRALAYGGGKMPGPVIEAAMALLPEVEFTQAYGLTETSSTLCVLLPRHHRAAMESTEPAQRRRMTSVGLPLPGVEIQIRDDSGKVLAPGQRGEIYVRGEQVSGEYVGKGSMLDANGWFATRDAGELDEEGYLFLAGRADDVIVRGAENMSPGEIEDALLTHAAVADVAVIGVPDEHWGEAVAAVVVLHAADAIDAHLQQSLKQELKDLVKATLRSSKVPQHIRFEQSLPYNETGKLLRRVVREGFVLDADSGVDQE